MSSARLASALGLSERAREHLEEAELYIWNLTAKGGPTEELGSLVRALAHRKPIPQSTDPIVRALHRSVSSLDRLGADFELVRYIVLDAYRVASVVWEAYSDGFEAGVQSCTEDVALA